MPESGGQLLEFSEKKPVVCVHRTRSVHGHRGTVTVPGTAPWHGHSTSQNVPLVEVHPEMDYFICPDHCDVLEMLFT